MLYTIFRNNLKLCDIKPQDSSELVQKEQAEDYIRMSFVLDAYVDIRIGDFISYFNQLYVINNTPQVVENRGNFQYECTFEGVIHSLKKTKCILTTNKGNGGAYNDYKFSLTGTARTFLQFIVDNLNRNSTQQYTVGTYKETSTETVDFNNWNVFEAIQELATKLAFNWFLEGTVLHFDSCTVQKPYVFMVGSLTGFTYLTRYKAQSSEMATIVYGYGSTENMPPRVADTGITYDSELLTENRLSFVGVDGRSKLENNVDLLGRIESVQEFDTIKPSFLGSVTALGNTVNVFFDSSVDFDLNQYLLSGIVPKITFLSGLLSGQTFTIGFGYSTKQYTLDTLTDETGTYPNTSIHAAIGDTYTLFDVYMPQSYIETAQTKLQAATQEYLDAHSTPQVYYEASVDDRYIKMNNYTLQLGDYIRIVSGVFGLDAMFPIKELVRNITNPNNYSIKFGDILPQGFVYSLKNANFTNKQTIYNISKEIITTNEVTNQVTNIVGSETEWQQI
jgi:hypothetical protein